MSPKIPKISHYLSKITSTYHQHSLNNSHLLLLSTLLQILGNVTIINDNDYKQYKMGNILIISFNHLHQYMYPYQHLENINKNEVNFLILGANFGLEILFLFSLALLTYSNTRNQFIQVLLACINFVKQTLNMQIFALLFSILQSSTYSHNTSTVILTIISIIITLIIQYYIIQFNFTPLFQNKHLNDQLYNSYEAKLQMLKKVIIAYIVFKHDLTHDEIIVLSILMSTKAILKLCVILKEKISIFDPFAQNLVITKQMFIGVYHFLYALRYSADIIRENIDYGFVTIFLMFCWSYYNCLQWIRFKILIKNLNQIESQNQCLIYIRLLYRAYKNYNDKENGMILASIIKEHINVCQEVDCCCFNVRKNRILERKQRFQQQFILTFIRSNFETLAKRYQSFTIEKSLLTFNIQVMDQFPKFYYQVSKIIRTNSDNMNLNQQYSLYIVSKQAERAYNLKNSYQSNIIAHNLIQNQYFIKELYQYCEAYCRNLAGVYQLNQKYKCNLNFIQKQLQQSYGNIESITKYITTVLSQNCISFQLINLSSFYTSYIINTVNWKEKLQQKLQYLIVRAEYRELKDINFNINLYSENGCVIGSMVEQQKFGHLTNISANAYKIFNYPRNDVMHGMDLNKLILPCLRQEHKRAMKNWVNTGKFKFERQGVFLEYFCCDLEENILRCITRFQVLVIEGDLIVYIGVIKRKEEDDGKYIAVDMNDIVDCHSKNIGQIFKMDLRTINIQSLIGQKQWNNIKKKVQQGSSDKFLVSLTTENSNETSEQSQFESLSPKLKKAKEVKFESISKSKPKFQKLQVKSRHFTNYLSINSPNRLNQKKESFYANIKVTKTFLNKAYFYLIHIEEILTNYEIASNSYIENDCFSRKKTFILKMKTFNTSNQSRVISTQKFISNVYNSNLEPINKKINVFEGSSTSSSKVQEQFTLRRIITKIEEKAQLGSKIPHNLLKKTTYLLLLFMISFIVLSFSHEYFYEIGANSFSQLIAADATVSDNFQLLQILYNQVHTIELYCKPEDPTTIIPPYSRDQSNCLYIIQETQRIYSILYPIMYTNVENIIKGKTYLQYPYYIYALAPVTITMNGGTIEIMAYQYMEYFLEIIQRIMQIVYNQYHHQSAIQINETSSYFHGHQSYDELINLLKSNWPELAKLNHKNLDIYQKISQTELQVIYRYVIVMTVVLVVLTVGFFYILFRYYHKESKLMFKILMLYRYIPMRLSVTSQKKFAKTMQTLHKKSWINVGQYIRTVSFQNISKPKQSYHIRQLEHLYTFPIGYKIACAALCFVVIIIIIIKTWQMSIFYSILLNINDNMNDLMHSENYLLEGYITYKNYYMFEVGNNTLLDSQELRKKQEQLIGALNTKLAESQVGFIEYSLDSMDLFKDISGSYIDDFETVMINSICQFQKSVSQQNYQNCQQMMVYKINQQGILDTVNYFQRTLYEQILQITKSPTNSTQYLKNKFKQTKFTDIDIQIIYMFKMFQQLQIKMIEGTTNTTHNQQIILSIINYVNMSISVLVMTYFLFRYQEQCRKLAEKYGYLISYPKEIILSSKFIEQSIIRIIEI